MIRILPLFLITACQLTTKTIVAECQLVETVGECMSVCTDLPEGSYPAYAVQCGGPGTDADDCVEAYWTIQGDEQGDQLCATCTDIEGDSGEEGPWTYLRLGVVECLDSETGAVVSMTTDSAEPPPSPFVGEPDDDDDEQVADFRTTAPSHPAQGRRVR